MQKHSEEWVRKGTRELKIGLEQEWGTGRMLLSQQRPPPGMPGLDPLGRNRMASGGFGVYGKGQNSEA